MTNNKTEFKSNKNIKYNNTFVAINNEFLDERSELMLSADELYVYILLSIGRDYENKIATTTKVLASIGHIQLIKGEERNIKRFKDTLVALRNKGAIRLVDANGEINDTFKQNDVIIVELVDTNTEFEGHTQVVFEDFYRFDNTEMLKIYLTCYKWYEGKKSNGRFLCEYDRWMRILDVTQPTAIKLVEKAESMGYITTYKGFYISNNRQEANQYKAIPLSKKVGFVDSPINKTEHSEIDSEAPSEATEEPESVSNVDENVIDVEPTIEPVEQTEQAQDESKKISFGKAKPAHFESETDEIEEVEPQDQTDDSFAEMTQVLGIPLDETKEQTNLFNWTVAQLEEAYNRLTKKDANGNNSYPVVQDYVLYHDIIALGKEKGLSTFEKKVGNAINNRIRNLQKGEKGKLMVSIKKNEAKIEMKNRDWQQGEISDEKRNDFTKKALATIAELNGTLEIFNAPPASDVATDLEDLFGAD